MHAEFAQDAHLGRTLPRTRTAALALPDGVLAAAARDTTERLRAKVDPLREVGEAEVEVFLAGFLARLRRVGAVWDSFLISYAKKGCNIFAYKNNPAEFAMLKTPRRPRYLSLLPYGKCDATTGDEAAFYRDWAFKALPGLEREVRVDELVIAEIYQAALAGLEANKVVSCEEAENQNQSGVWGIRPDAYQRACSGAGMAV
jgi:DEAD/DEAH box helicase domain-containing protein